MMKRLLSMLVFGVLAACSSPDPKLNVRDAWARETGESDLAAAYMTIDNKGGADELTGARASIGRATLHESSTEGGIMRMRPIDPEIGLVVPSNGRLRLGAGGTHIMIGGLKKPLKAGDRFDMTLLFRKAGPYKVTVTVKSAAWTAASQ